MTPAAADPPVRRVEVAVALLIDEGLEDWVSLDTVLAYARQITDATDADFRTVAAQVLAELFDNDLVVPGRLGETGFEAEPRDLDRVFADCADRDWAPKGAGFWIANTPSADRVARARRAGQRSHRHRTVPRPGTDAPPPAGAAFGRTPIGGRTELYLARATEAQIRDRSLEFGKRRFGAVVRIAVRRLLTAPTPEVAAHVEARRRLPVDQVRRPVFLGEELRAELLVVTGEIGATLTETMRVACEILVEDLVAAERAGTPIDLAGAVNDEVYRGAEPNRSEIIARHRRRRDRTDRTS